MWQRGLIGRTASARVPSHKWSAFTSREEQLGSVSSTRERSVDICSRLLPLDESGWDLETPPVSAVWISAVGFYLSTRNCIWLHQRA
ncbi:hypothetical protein TNCV_2074481 [Trichonephila clavipes]|nr:hypothetical protein TNCV_2074481 [Trichonephila clavipes]